MGFADFPFFLQLSRPFPERFGSYSARTDAIPLRKSDNSPMGRKHFFQPCSRIGGILRASFFRAVTDLFKKQSMFIK